MSILSEANRIKDRLRACQSEEEVDQVSAEERATVMSWTKIHKEAELVESLKRKPDEAGLMFLHVIRLKKFMIDGFKQGGAT